jgi:hypothetical protein
MHRRRWPEKPPSYISRRTRRGSRARLSGRRDRAGSSRLLPDGQTRPRSPPSRPARRRRRRCGHGPGRRSGAPARRGPGGPSRAWISAARSWSSAARSWAAGSQPCARRTVERVAASCRCSRSPGFVRTAPGATGGAARRGGGHRPRPSAPPPARRRSAPTTLLARSSIQATVHQGGTNWPAAQRSRTLRTKRSVWLTSRPRRWVASWSSWASQPGDGSMIWPLSRPVGACGVARCELARSAVGKTDGPQPGVYGPVCRWRLPGDRCGTDPARSRPAE